MSTPSYDAQESLSNLLHDLMRSATSPFTGDERDYVLKTAADALMETYQHGYYDACVGAPSKVTGQNWVQMPERSGAAMDANGSAIYTGPRYEAAVCPDEIENSRNWSYEPTVGELGLAATAHLTPEDYDD